MQCGLDGGVIGVEFLGETFDQWNIKNGGGQVGGGGPGWEERGTEGPAEHPEKSRAVKTAGSGPVNGRGGGLGGHWIGKGVESNVESESPRRTNGNGNRHPDGAGPAGINRFD